MQMRRSIILSAFLASLAISAISASGDEFSYKKDATTTTTTTTTSSPTSSTPDETTDETDATSTTTPSLTSSTPDEPNATTTTTTTTRKKPSIPFDDIDEAELESFARTKAEHESIVEKIRAGDTKAKEQYERIILSMRYKQIKANKSESDTDYDVVLNFIDDYVLRLSSSLGSTATQEPLMKLKDLLSLVDINDKLKERIKDFGRKFESAECGSECLGQEMGQIMTEAIGSMMGPMGDSEDDASDTDKNAKQTTSNKTINIDIDIGADHGKSDATDDAGARSEL